MKLFTILLVPLFLIQGNDALLRRLKKPKPEMIHEEKVFLFPHDSEMEESNVRKFTKSSFYNDIPEDYEKTLANVCLYEGISAARDLLGNVPMTQIMEDKELIRNTLNALMPMEMTGFLKIRRQNCINWILTQFVATQKPTPEIVGNSKVNDKAYELTFAEGFVENPYVLGVTIVPFMQWSNWAYLKLNDIYGVKGLRLCPWIYNLSSFYRQNKFWKLFWNLNEDNYDELTRLSRAVFKSNIFFSILNHRERYLIDAIQKMKEMLNVSLLVETLNMAKLIGETSLEHALLPLLTPEQAYFYGLKINEQIEKEIASIFTDHHNNSKTILAVKYVESFVEFAFAGRNYLLITNFMSHLPKKIFLEFSEFIKRFSDGSNDDFFKLIHCPLDY